MLKQILSVLSLISIFPCGAHAQQKDSMQTMRQFITVCNSYKQQVPLYLGLNYSSSANVITNADDTVSHHARFYLLGQKAYMQFGEMEEVVDDTMALIISGRMKRMFLYKNAQAVIGRLKAAMGMKVPQSSIEEWCKKFEASKTSDGLKETIELRSRSQVYGTGLPKETINLLYNVSTKVPLEVINVKRALLPLNADEYDHYKKEPLPEGYLVNIDNAYYLVKEQTLVFRYTQLEHNSSLALPVSIADRVIKTGIAGNTAYKPVKGFEEYVLSEE